MTKNSAVPKKGPQMATTAPVRGKTAEEELLESFGEMIDSAAGKLSHKEFMKVAKRTNKTLDRALAAHSRRRETA